VTDPWSAWEAIAAADPVALSDAQRALFAIGWLRTEVNNGGFDQLFFNDAGDVVPEALAAARSAGATELAALIERAIAVLGTAYPTDRSRRQDALLTLTQADEARPAALDGEYFALEGSTDLDALMRDLAQGAR
jgi:hypothetical protein